MNALEARKRLLIAESELNRARLASSLASRGSGVADIATGATRVGTLLSSLAAVFGSGRSPPPAGGSLALFGSVLSLGTTLWQMFSRRR